MKTIITFTFILITLSILSQTTREEVVKRTEGGLKLEVLTYSGTGNSEKLVKRTTYDYTTVYKSITSKPIRIDYFGNYELVYSSGNAILYYGPIKIEKYDMRGLLYSTWKITDDNNSNVTYTILP
jgi:hypothetical protein